MPPTDSDNVVRDRQGAVLGIALTDHPDMPAGAPTGFYIPILPIPEGGYTGDPVEVAAAADQSAQRIAQLEAQVAQNRIRDLEAQLAATGTTAVPAEVPTGDPSSARSLEEVAAAPADPPPPPPPYQGFGSDT